MFLGNILPKVRDNYFVGIKTPWTLSDSEVWRKTHRLGGYAFFFGGLLIALSSFLANTKILFILIMAVACFVSLVPNAMSYVWWRQKNRGP
jgi:uncharacterized membrane protein